MNSPLHPGRSLSGNHLEGRVTSLRGVTHAPWRSAPSVTVVALRMRHSFGTDATLANVINKVCHSGLCRDPGREMRPCRRGSCCFSSNAVLGGVSRSLRKGGAGFVRRTWITARSTCSVPFNTLRRHAIDPYTRSASTGNERPGFFAGPAVTPMGRRARNLPFCPDLCNTANRAGRLFAPCSRLTSEPGPTPRRFGHRLHIKPAVGG
ncbi:hypothetical protein BDD21_0545 [Thiocapsa rosea]|uniref:Uncharacterized protein n=1 Tax=Thiocapsa rosea TaxID=69360 RepID=A0A495V3P9_9GAMM|nr:hypothetical protein BDD21_0545 [Thiocapsa rosea]